MNCVWVSYFTVEYFQSNFQLSFSERGSTRRTAEEAAYVYLMNFLDSCEGIYIYSHVFFFSCIQRIVLKNSNVIQLIAIVMLE